MVRVIFKKKNYDSFRYEITFVDKSNTNESFTLEMSLKSNYMEMAAKVGQRLGVNPLYIQFYRSQPYKYYCHNLI